MEGWDADGMQAVATARLQPMLHDAETGAAGSSKLVQQAVVLHTSCLSSGATPRHYVAFVSLCSSIYTKKRSQLLQQQNFLKVHVGLLLYSLPHLVPLPMLAHNAHGSLVAYAEVHSHHDKLSSHWCIYSSCDGLLSL